MNRTIAPSITNDFHFSFLEPEVVTLSNGINIYYINGAKQEVVRIEVIYNAGNAYESQNLIASFTNELLGEGTKNNSAAAINEKLDFYGAYLSKETGRDQGMIGLYSLNKNLAQVLPLFSEVLQDSVYPQSEFDIHLKNRAARFLDNLKKTDYVCRNEFPRLIYGQHAYGRPLKKEDFENLDPDTVRAFYKDQYQQSTPVVFVAGYIGDPEKQMISEMFSHIQTGNTKNVPDALPTYTPSSEKIRMEGTIQSALRIGKPVVNIDHPHYPSLAVMNTMLGGYFGSRLMKNIREEKGFTYGIGSGISSFEQATLFFISTEVGKDVTHAALDEIYKEIEIIRHQAASKEELETVKNYMLGNFLKSLDGPFAQGDKIKTRIIRGLDENYYAHYIEAVKKVSAEDVLNAAQAYLDPEGLSELVVGDV